MVLKMLGLTDFMHLLIYIFVSYSSCNGLQSNWMPKHSLTEQLRDDIKENTKVVCEDPSFHPVGEYCLFIDNRVKGSWYEMRDLCQAIGGDLVNLNDANILYHVSNYINDNAMGDVSFWVGATDQDQEGSWVWVSDNSSVKMGTPLWGTLFGQEPNGDEYENCAILSRLDFFYMHDDVCDFPYHGVICQEGTSKQSDLTNIIYTESIFSTTPKECPPDYIHIWHSCVHIKPENQYTWMAARATCEMEGTHLVKIDDANFLGAIYDYLNVNELPLRAWVDGTDVNFEGNWTFYDGTPVKRGTPYWLVASQSDQEPNSGTSNNCINIRVDDYYYFKDEDCAGDSGIICQFDI